VFRTNLSSLGAAKIGTEHLLLALLSDETILSSRILKNLNVELPDARKVVLRKLGIADTPKRRNDSRTRRAP
ncbi:Clp protease N-terminal domain-containing protein, partial [Levilactobacillus spicheri]